MLHFINSIYSFMQWPGVVALMALESACIPLPSEIIMPLAGWMLVKNQSLGMWYVFIIGALGALGCLIGSVVIYWIAKAGGRPVLEKYGKYLLITPHDIDTADRWFAKYGNLSIFVSRLLPLVRTFISLPAGVAKTNFAKFVFYTFTGSLIWCVGLAYGGYQLGQNWDRINTVINRATPVILIVFVLLILFYVYRHLKRLRNT